MSSTLVTYIGFVVAVLILLWGFGLVARRYFVRKRKVTSNPPIDTWIPLEPETKESTEADEVHEDEGSSIDSHIKAQQNGHYSQSKNKH